MADIPELTRTFRMTYALGATIAVGLVIGTWVAAMIFFEFEHLKSETKRIETRMENRTTRNLEEIKGNKGEIEELKMPNSDE